MEGKKFIVGLCGIIVLVLLGGLYKVNIYDEKIVVSLPSDVCNAATLRVTKDDFTLKCGRYIAFQADTITEYYKTYGTDEWVRNNRFVGRNKKHITLEFTDYGNYFDIVRKTRYRKGRQNIDDGVLYETYTFTKDKVKITYNYEVNNKALHRISMRIKKQVDSYLDAFDPNGHTGRQVGNILSYQGYGNLLIDPTVSIAYSPSNASDTGRTYREGDTIPFICHCNDSTNESSLGSMSFWWNAYNESIFYGVENTTITANTSTTYSQVIPHPLTVNFPGVFKWGCKCCNTSGTAGSNCTYSTNSTIDARYKPEVPTIFSPNTTHLNLLNGSGADWDMHSFYPGYVNVSFNRSIYINWTHPGIRDNNTNITWNLSYYGASNSTRYWANFLFVGGDTNDTVSALWNVSNLDPDLYYVTLHACNRLNFTLCENDTLDIPVDIFDYAVNISTGETKIRFSPQPTYTLGAALGQTAIQGIIAVDWLGYRAPDGLVNLSINHTEADDCMDIYAYHENTPASAVHLVNDSYVTALNVTDADPDYIWLWATKSGCGTTTTDFSFDLDLFFGGT